MSNGKSSALNSTLNTTAWKAENEDHWLRVLEHKRPRFWNLWRACGKTLQRAREDLDVSVLTLSIQV
jgi:hypothetical protein